MLKVRYEYWRSEEDGQWYFHLIAPNGGVIVHSGAYMSENDCLEGIEDVRRYARLAIVTKSDIEACS